MPARHDKQLREVFHLLFLERLLKTADPNLFVLKGGVNLRFFFLSPRYSEDMDLDVFGGGVETLRKNGYKILVDPSFRRVLQTYGIENIKVNDPAKAKQTETTQRFRLRLVNAVGEEFPTKVEFSRRAKLDKAGTIRELIPPNIVRPYQRLSFECQHYTGDFAAAQKIRALGGRAETQARDVFDLYVLFLGGNINPQKTRRLVSKPELEKACLALFSLDYDAYRGQVVEYLDSAAKVQFGTRKSWESLCEVVLEIVE